MFRLYSEMGLFIYVYQPYYLSSGDIEYNIMAWHGTLYTVYTVHIYTEHLSSVCPRVTDYIGKHKSFIVLYNHTLLLRCNCNRLHW